MAHTNGMRNPAGGKGAQKPSSRKISKNDKEMQRRHQKQSIPFQFRRVNVVGKGIVTYVIDTNVIMDAWDSLFKFEEHNVCIVGQVWKELDASKKGRTTEAWNVRRAIAAIDKLLFGKTSVEIQQGVQLVAPPELANGKPHTGKLILDFSHPKMPEGLNTDLDLGHPDDRIILSCLALQKSGKRVVLVTNDASCRIKASVAGIESEEYLGDVAGLVPSDEDITPGFHTMPEGFLDSAIKCSSVAGRSRYEFGSDFPKGIVRNEFLVIPNAPPLRVVRRTEKSKVVAVAETFDYFDDLKAMGIELRNLGQEFAMQLLLDPSLPAVSVAGQAGSGKTFLTLASAVYQVISLNRYKRIIFTRSTQDADEPVGFLPGELTNKISPWMGALWDNIESLLEKGKYAGDKKASAKKLKELIQIDSLNFMKGRSLMDTFIIVDETQDLTPRALKMISTRVGEGSKIVFLGNVAQIDNPHLTEYTCGLSVFIRTLRESHLTGHVTLQDGVRSPFATLAEEML